MARRENSINHFESALHARERDLLVLRLYVAGGTAASLRALANLQAICKDHLRDRHQLEVIDAYQNPSALRRDQVVAVPTLVKVAPPPVRRIVGDLSDLQRVLTSLNVQLRAPGDATRARKTNR